MKYKKVENKRTLAIIIALGILLFSALGNIFLNNIQINRLEEKVEESSWANRFLGGNTEDNMLQGTDAENRIAVFSIDGVIGADTASGWNDLLGAESSEIGLDFILEDPTIRGVLLNINSPGGGVYDSAEIWSKVKEIQEELDIPVYTTMGEVAASGGYYIAAPSEKIFASEETLTGSIGVISDYINIAELEEKVGIKHEIIKSGKHKDIGSSNREMTDEEREINQTQVDEFYDKFVDIIVEGRNMSEEDVRNLADGQVYTGKQAYENGLVDEIGYFDDALDTMIEDLDLEDPQVFEKTATPSAWNQLLVKANQLMGASNNERDIFSLENETLQYIEEKQSKGHLPEFYYMYGGF